MTAFRKLGTFRGESSFRTWLLAITWRKAIDRRKSINRWVSRLASPAASDFDGAAGPGRASAGDRPVAGRRVADDERQRQQLRRLIASLPKKLRDPLLLSCSGDYTYEQIAADAWRAARDGQMAHLRGKTSVEAKAWPRRDTDVNDGDEQELDRAIDVVARRMLDVEPPAGLRHAGSGAALPRRGAGRLGVVRGPGARRFDAMAVLWPRPANAIAPSRAGTDYHLPSADHDCRAPAASAPVRRRGSRAQRTNAPDVGARDVRSTNRCRSRMSQTLPPLAAPSPIGVRTIAERQRDTNR